MINELKNQINDYLERLENYDTKGFVESEYYKRGSVTTFNWVLDKIDELEQNKLR